MDLRPQTQTSAIPVNVLKKKKKNGCFYSPASQATFGSLGYHVTALTTHWDAQCHLVGEKPPLKRIMIGS